MPGELRISPELAIEGDTNDNHPPGTNGRLGSAGS